MSEISCRYCGHPVHGCGLCLAHGGGPHGDPCACPVHHNDPPFYTREEFHAACAAKDEKIADQARNIANLKAAREALEKINAALDSYLPKYKGQESGAIETLRCVYRLVRAALAGGKEGA